jgi:hypothetical protein
MLFILKLITILFLCLFPFFEEEIIKLVKKSINLKNAHHEKTTN